MFKKYNDQILGMASGLNFWGKKNYNYGKYLD